MTNNNKNNTNNSDAASVRNSPLAMPKTCQAQLDIYKRALDEEDSQLTADN